MSSQIRVKTEAARTWKGISKVVCEYEEAPLTIRNVHGILYPSFLSCMQKKMRMPDTITADRAEIVLIAWKGKAE